MKLALLFSRPASTTKTMESAAQKKSSFALEVKKTFRLLLLRCSASSSTRIGPLAACPGCTETGTSCPRSGFRLWLSRSRSSQARSTSLRQNGTGRPVKEISNVPSLSASHEPCTCSVTRNTATSPSPSQRWISSTSCRAEQKYPSPALLCTTSPAVGLSSRIWAIGKPVK